MADVLYEIMLVYLVALLVWCALVIVWNALAPKLSDALERRRAKRRARVLHVENIPGTTGYRIKAR